MFGVGGKTNNQTMLPGNTSHKTYEAAGPRYRTPFCQKK